MHADALLTSAPAALETGGPTPGRRLRVLLLNQCFYPDHVATAQHLTDLALGLVEAGHQVTAVASSRGYDDPERRFPASEVWKGVHVRRLWTPGLGKTARWRRFLDFAAFWVSATTALLRLPRFDVTVCLTSPPLISSLGQIVAQLKGGAVVHWVMDLNPDEAVAAGWLKAGGVPERFMSALQRWSFGHAARLIALDRFMAARLRAKHIPAALIHTDPPWSHDDTVGWDPAGRDAFRARHGLTDRFVVMYSGNHSPCHPLDSVLAAALELAAHSSLHFLFVGGGSEHAKVRDFAARHSLTNITCLPYQPKESLAASLSAADLHLVVMGPPFVGLVHPCKIYNILTLGRPFLALGPDESHLTDLAAQVPDQRYALTGHLSNTPGIVRQLQQAAADGPLPPSTKIQDLARQFSRQRLRPRLIDVITAAAASSYA